MKIDRMDRRLLALFEERFTPSKFPLRIGCAMGIGYDMGAAPSQQRHYSFCEKTSHVCIEFAVLCDMLLEDMSSMR